MSSVLTKNWKENGKAVKGLREGFLWKICTSEKVVKTLVLNPLFALDIYICSIYKCLQHRLKKIHRPQICIFSKVRDICRKWSKVFIINQQIWHLVAMFVLTYFHEGRGSDPICPLPTPGVLRQYLSLKYNLQLAVSWSKHETVKIRHLYMLSGLTNLLALSIYICLVCWLKIGKKMVKRSKG